MDHFRGHSIFPNAACVGKEESKGEWDECPQYPKYTPSDHRNSNGSNYGGNRTGCSLQNWHKEEAAAEDPNDQPNEEDPELTRKRKELQEIKEQIMLKRAFLARITVNPVHNTEEARPSKSNQPLQDRIKHILRQRNRLFRSQDPVAKIRRSSINIQHNHPLKHRVKVALEQRFVVDHPVEAQNTEQMPFFSAPLSPQISISPVEEEEQGNQGFMRFLNILNKGVDIDKLKEVVNDDRESTMQQPHSSQKWGETLSETIAFDSLLVEAEQQPKEEPQLPNPDEQQKHLQNILKSLGLSLGTDEMSKLADRTQERLYGKKPRTEEEDRKEFETQQKEGEEKYSPAHCTRISSSSFNSSSSSNASPPRKQSPQRRQRSRSSSRRRSCSSSRRRRNRSSSRRRTSTSSPQRYRSPYSSPRHSRQSTSPYRHRNSNSPYRRTDSLSSCRYRSPHSTDHGDPPLQFPQYPYAPSQYYNSHYPPQMNSDPYIQYAAYYNCWSYSHPTVPGLANQNYPQIVPPASPNQQLEPQNSNSLLGPYPGGAEFISNQSMDGLPDILDKTEKRTSCLMTIKRISICTSMTERERKMMKQQRRAKAKQRKKELRLHPPIPTNSNVNKDQNCTTKMKNTIMPCQVGMIPNLITNVVQAEDSSGAPAGSVQPSNRFQNTRKKRKKKKKQKAAEYNAEMMKLLNDRHKLSELEGELVEINDTEKPLQRTRYKPLKITLKGSVERTDAEGGEEKKPMLTEQEIKANLKSKLEAFNSRMKKPTPPAQSLMPQNIKGEDEI